MAYLGGFHNFLIHSIYCASDESDEDEDDEAALILELEQIRKERAEEKLRKVCDECYFI